MTSHRPVMAVVIAALGALAMVLTLWVPPAAADGEPSAADTRDRIEYLVNRERARHGLRRLRISLYTQRRSRDHSEDMARAGGPYHDDNVPNESPEGTRAWGENVGRTTAEHAPRRMHAMFMNSPGHRSIVLSARWTHMGIGVVKKGGYTYVTQRFIDKT